MSDLALRGGLAAAAGGFSDTAWSPLAWAQLIAQREYLHGASGESVVTSNRVELKA